MAHDAQCDSFPDIWKKPPEQSDPSYESVMALNRHHGRIYRAARHILVKDFSAPENIPASPEDFPGNPPGTANALTDAQIAQVAAIHGILLADDWDPSMGKSSAASDDLVIDAEEGETMVVDRRFVEAVVAAVQEYTSRAALFNKCFLFLKKEGLRQGAVAAARSQ